MGLVESQVRPEDQDPVCLRRGQSVGESFVNTCSSSLPELAVYQLQEMKNKREKERERERERESRMKRLQ